MKKIIILLLSVFSLTACAQHTTGFTHYVIAVSGGTPVDTSFEALTYNSFKVVDYDITRPNKQLTVTGNTSFEIDNVSLSQSGQVRFIFTTTLTLTLNGHLNFTMPTGAGTYVITYTNVGGTINWYYP